MIISKTLKIGGIILMAWGWFSPLLFKINLYVVISLIVGLYLYLFGVVAE